MYFFRENLVTKIFSPCAIHARKMTIFKTLSLAKTLLPLAFQFIIFDFFFHLRSLGIVIWDNQGLLNPHFLIVCHVSEGVLNNVIPRGIKVPRKHRFTYKDQAQHHSQGFLFYRNISTSGAITQTSGLPPFHPTSQRDLFQPPIQKSRKVEKKVLATLLRSTCVPFVQSRWHKQTFEPIVLVV